MEAGSVTDFGFTVRWRGRRDEFPDDDIGWEVDLPHQCEEWSITGPNWGPPVDRYMAMAYLTQFITEAENALNVLRSQGDTRPERFWQYPPNPE